MCVLRTVCGFLCSCLATASHLWCTCSNVAPCKLAVLQTGHRKATVRLAFALRMPVNPSWHWLAANLAASCSGCRWWGCAVDQPCSAPSPGKRRSLIRHARTQGALEVWEYSREHLRRYKPLLLGRDVRLRHVPFTWFPLVRVLCFDISTPAPWRMPV